ncbi:MAG: AAA family ATPase [Nitrospirae bacterium]|nr:AAA family ATPase [Nitrospirota bacterium]
MYEKHFSFKYKPFDLVPNPDFIFLSGTHHKAITYLDYGIKEKIGFILLTGEIGSGKTTIIRSLIKNLNGSVKLSRINNTKVSSEQLISMINEDFGLVVEGKGKSRLLSELNEFLIEQYSKKSQPILLIDEAQNLSPDLLEEIRLLSNLETDRSKLLQIILVGQPELKRVLMLPELIQLRQRINISYHISPLMIDETAGYIKHRLAIAGNPDAIRLQDDMLQIIYQFSRGIPRLINILCDFALLTAYAEGEKEVSIDIIREVAKDLEARDYWSEAQDKALYGQNREGGAPELLKAAGDIALRLIRLEEMVKNVPDLKAIQDRVVRMEEEVARLINADEGDKTAEILDRLIKLERMPVVMDAGKEDELQSEDEKRVRKELHRFTRQIEEITNTITYLNKRLKDQ